MVNIKLLSIEKICKNARTLKKFAKVSTFMSEEMCKTSSMWLEKSHQLCVSTKLWTIDSEVSESCVTIDSAGVKNVPR